MKKINVSTKQMGKFAGKWIAIQKNRIIAVATKFSDIASVVTKTANDKTPDDRIPAAFKVPRSNEGPYIL